MATKNKKFTKKTSLRLISTALAGGLLTGGVAQADSNPFGYEELPSGYMIAESKEGRCGEGRCGEKKGKKEGRCGEGQCGEKKGKKEGRCGEGQCGEMKGKKDDCKKDRKKGKKEGSCGEGKCGEGQCGGHKKK